MRTLQSAVRFTLGSVAILAMLALAVPVFADPVAKSIDLLVPAKIGRT